MNSNSIRRADSLPTPSILTLIRLNLVILGLWAVSFMLSKVGIPYLTLLFGTLALFAPGLCLGAVLEQLAEAKTKIFNFVLWAALFTFVITPAACYGISLFLLRQSPISNILTPFFIWWSLCLVIAIGVSFLKRQPTSLSDLSLDRTTKREIKYIVGAYVFFLLINFIVYPLLPEGDGYSYLIRWKSIQVDPSLFATETRPLFLIFVNLCSRLLQIDAYWVFKVFLPLSHVTNVIACYIFTRNFISDQRYRILLSLSPLFFPVVLQESLISRPQSFFLIAFLPSIVLISEVMADNKNIRQIYWLFAIFIIGAVGIKIHTLFAFIALTGLISIVIFLRRELIKRPLDSFIIALGLLVLLAPQLSKTRLVPDSWHVVELFVASFRQGHFDLWFLDHYRNVDGIELGWPGLLSLFYYGYNLGLVFPLFFILLLFRKKIGTFKFLFREKYWAILFLFIFFFFIAEIAPRFQIAYLPDRAWLFVALLFSLSIPLMVIGLKKNRGQNFLIFIALICVFSIAAGTGLTYAKQGWVTPEEVATADFIETNIPTNAIILAQGGTRMMLRYYTSRASIRPKDEAIFLTGEKDALATYLKTEEVAYQEAIAYLPNRNIELNTILNEMYQQKGKIDLSDEEQQKLLELLRIVHDQKDNYKTNIERLSDVYPTVGRPIYLMYNQNKFDSLYGSRGWWRSSNFYGANIKRLNENYPAIYNKNGITIWEARK